MIRFATGLEYIFFYYNVLLLITVIFCFVLITKKDVSNFNPKVSSFIGFILFVLLVFYMGFRPNSYVFGDMPTYAHSFELAKSGWNNKLSGRDVLFDSLITFCAQTTTVEGFFFIVTLIYLVPCLLVSRKFFKQYWFLGFLMLWTSLSFWSYGTNGLRNGMATSIFMLAFVFDSKLIRIALMLAAVNMHKSLMLPTAAYILTLVFSNTTLLIRLWLLCIPLSFVAGGIFESIFSSIGFGDIDQRMSVYTNSAAIMEYNTGFRIDFLLYSGTAIFAGWYYTEKLNYTDKLYKTLFNIYIITNAFWVLVIRAPFSNRFAYLSWFLMGFVIVYPLLKHKLIKNQLAKIGMIILANYAFTYTLLVILGKGV